ncbi:MAG: dihydropteroate synthase [Terriglobales bacterium]
MNYLRPKRTWRLRDQKVELGARTWVMAILNLTPDSFYATSRIEGTGALLTRARQAVAEGADMLDVGAESTRPGAAPLTAAAEQARLLPGIRTLRKEFPTALLSADTRHAATAAAAIEAGADIINDVSGLGDPEMGPLLARTGAAAILMHHRGDFASMQHLPPLVDLVTTVLAGLAAILAGARAAGVGDDQIVLDPGFGFGKNLDQNLPLLTHFERLHELGRPLLAGVSRKSFLQPPEGDSGPEDRLPASLAAATAAVLAGAHILRVHDVGATASAARFADRLLLV